MTPFKSWMLVALFAATACGEEDTGPLMRPGDNCMDCHSSGGEASDVPWTVAGTVFPSANAPKSEGLAGAIVRVTDADGKKIELRSNEAGNFFTGTRLARPLQVEVEFEGRVAPMPIPAETGACNGCHKQPPANAAPGRIDAP